MCFIYQTGVCTHYLPMDCQVLYSKNFTIIVREMYGSKKTAVSLRVRRLVTTSLSHICMMIVLIIVNIKLNSAGIIQPVVHNLLNSIRQILIQHPTYMSDNICSNAIFYGLIRGIWLSSYGSFQTPSDNTVVRQFSTWFFVNYNYYW